MTDVVSNGSGYQLVVPIKKQILAVRDTALTNMFDVNMVQRIANDMGFYELVIYLEDHRREYAHFILTGQTE